jgi:hypothetical protein
VGTICASLRLFPPNAADRIRRSVAVSHGASDNGLALYPANWPSAQSGRAPVILRTGRRPAATVLRVTQHRCMGPEFGWLYVADRAGRGPG